MKNGDVEEGADDKPAGWTYVGRSELDWSKAELERLHSNGRPDFSIGRGRGEWSRTSTYAGKGALLDIAVDPPLSRNQQWYGRSPVDGYWLSDHITCEPGSAYLAAAWIKPGAAIVEAWYGPLELQFFDRGGNRLAPQNYVRCGLDSMPPGVWSYWVSMPWVCALSGQCPCGCVSDTSSRPTRAAGDGPTPTTWPSGNSARRRPIPSPEEIGARTEAFRQWYLDAHAQVKPPYLPAPALAAEYESCWGRTLNATLGNLFQSPDEPARLTFQLANLLGEPRVVSLRITRYDWLGTASKPVVLQGVKLSGYGQAKAVVKLPPSKSYGAFYLDVEVLEGEAEMGRFSGRYAVMPPLASADGARKYGASHRWCRCLATAGPSNARWAG